MEEFMENSSMKKNMDSLILVPEAIYMHEKAQH